MEDKLSQYYMFPESSWNSAFLNNYARKMEKCFR